MAVVIRLVLWLILFVAIFYWLILKPISTGYKKTSNASRENVGDRWIKQVTDPELEKKLSSEIDNLDNYEKICDRIKQFYPQHKNMFDFLAGGINHPVYGKLDKVKIEIRPWNVPGGDPRTIDSRKYMLLQCYMITFGKLTQRRARGEVASTNNSTGDIYSWLETPPWESGRYKKVDYSRPSFQDVFY